MPMTIDERLELFYGPIKGRERFEKADELTGSVGKKEPLQTSTKSLQRLVFLLRYCAHTPSHLQRARLDWAEEKDIPIDDRSVFMQVYEYGMHGFRPSWLTKLPPDQDLAFDCWCRRTIEVTTGIPQSEFPPDIEEWIAWFSEQLSKVLSGQPYETSYEGPVQQIEGPNPFDIETPFP